MKKLILVKTNLNEETVYRCKCRFCGSTMEIAPEEFKYLGGFTLTWPCGNCKRFINRENVLALQKKKVFKGATFEYEYKEV